MPPTIPLFAKIKDFSAFEEETQYAQSQYLSMKIKDPNNVETADSEEPFQLPIQRFKFRLRCNQISFEKNFMHQHIEAFDFYVENYITEIFEDEVEGAKNFINETLFPKKSNCTDSLFHIVENLKMDNPGIFEKKASIFMEDLGQLEKLEEFLQYICQKSCKDVATEFLLLAMNIWEHYLDIRREQMSYETLIEYSKKLADQNWEALKRNQLINFLNFNQTLIKPKLKHEKRMIEERKFIEFITVTLFLIIQEYFQNPYHKYKVEAQLKRHIFFTNNSLSHEYDSFSQDEESEECIFLRSKKKRK